jgi:hypothetical protein
MNQSIESISPVSEHVPYLVVSPKVNEHDINRHPRRGSLRDRGEEGKGERTLVRQRTFCSSDGSDIVISFLHPSSIIAMMAKTHSSCIMWRHEARLFLVCLKNEKLAQEIKNGNLSFNDSYKLQRPVNSSPFSIFVEAHCRPRVLNNGHGNQKGIQESLPVNFEEI